MALQKLLVRTGVVLALSAGILMSTGFSSSAFARGGESQTTNSTSPTAVVTGPTRDHEPTPVLTPEYPGELLGLTISQSNSCSNNHTVVLAVKASNPNASEVGIKFQYTIDGDEVLEPQFDTVPANGIRTNTTDTGQAEITGARVLVSWTFNPHAELPLDDGGVEVTFGALKCTPLSPPTTQPSVITPPATLYPQPVATTTTTTTASATTPVAVAGVTKLPNTGWDGSAMWRIGAFMVALGIGACLLGFVPALRDRIENRRLRKKYQAHRDIG